MNATPSQYFVLAPRGADPYAEASRLAMLAYAQAIGRENARLAAELRAWVGREDTADAAGVATSGA
jgi:hypothetical protein